MLFSRLPIFQAPPLSHVPHGRYALYQSGKVAIVVGVCVRVGVAVEWGEPLMDVLTDGVYDDTITAPANGIVRWVHPHIGTVKRGTPVALLEMDAPPVALHTARVVMPHSAPLSPALPKAAPPSPATLSLATATIPHRRSTMGTVNLEIIRDETPFPYGLTGPTKRRTFHIPESAGAWIDELSGKDGFNIPVAHVMQIMIYSFAVLPPAQRLKRLEAWQRARKEAQ